MTEKHYSIEIAIGDAWLSVSGPESFVEDKFYELYEEHGFSELEVGDVPSDGTNPTEGSSGSATTVDKGKTINEYLSDSQISSKKDNALVVGWYLEKVEGKDNFTLDEIEKKAESSKVPLGKNLTRDLGDQVEYGRLHPGAERDGEDAYWVTDTGEEYLREKGVID